MGFFSWLFGKRAAPVPTLKVPRALLIGNIGYPTAPLNGCVNDAFKTAAMLRDLYRGYFPLSADVAGEMQGQVRILQDAPKAQIIDACKWLRETAGEKVLLTSGHGVPVPSPTEPDGFIEAFCPIDFDWSPDTMITDDEFVELFSTSVGPFNWLSDSCHSGDLTRTLGRKQDRPKVFPIPTAIRNMLAGRRRIRRAIAKGEMNVGFVSGCRSDQTSADAYIDGQYCGAMTHYFLEALRENPGAKLKDVVKRTNELLRNNGYDQSPQCEGAFAGKPFLGS